MTGNESVLGSLRSLPDAVYVGMSKSGSTYIYQILKEHPEVFVPEIKDIYFFDKEYERGLSWYADFFSPARPGQVKVELSHDYLFSDIATQRLKADLPGVKTIICLREPLDWLVSKYFFEQARREVGILDLSDKPENQWLRDESDLAVNVGRYLETFDRKDILILFYEDLKKNPADFCQKIFSFLSVDPSFVPPSMRKVVLPAHEARVKWLAFCAQKVADKLRSFGLQSLVGFLKNRSFIENILYRPAKDRYTLTVAEKKMALDYFGPKVAALERIIDTPLPPEWKKNFP